MQCRDWSRGRRTIVGQLGGVSDGVMGRSRIMRTDGHEREESSRVVDQEEPEVCTSV
jgi:hypothetical protein